MKSTTSRRLIQSLLACTCLALLSAQGGCTSTSTRASTGELIDDGVITTRVKTALLRDESTPGTAIKVETFKGVVQLSGFVDSLTQKTRAQEIASTVPGVQDVVNNITVK